MFQWLTPPSQWQSHLHEPKHCYCKLSTVSCTHRFTMCPHQHRHTALQKLLGTMEIQKAGVGICTIVGEYQCECVRVREWVSVLAWVSICACVWLSHRQTAFQHVSVVAITIIRAVPLHDTKHQYCKLSILSCKHRFTSRPHVYLQHSSLRYTTFVLLFSTNPYTGNICFVR